MLIVAFLINYGMHTKYTKENKSFDTTEWLKLCYGNLNTFFLPTFLLKRFDYTFIDDDYHSEHATTFRLISLYLYVVWPKKLPFDSVDLQIKSKINNFVQILRRIIERSIWNNIRLRINYRNAVDLFLLCFLNIQKFQRLSKIIHHN